MCEDLKDRLQDAKIATLRSQVTAAAYYGAVMIGDPPLMQPEVVELVEPVPMLDRVPTPLQAVPCDRVTDRLIAPDTLGTDGSV